MTFRKTGLLCRKSMSSASQEISRHCHVHDSTSCHFSLFLASIILSCTFRSSKRSPSIRFRTKTLYIFIFFLMRATCTAYLMLLYYLLTHLLNPWSKVFLEKPVGYQLVKKFPHFMEDEGSLPRLQVRLNCPYPEPNKYSPCPHPTF